MPIDRQSKAARYRATAAHIRELADQLRFDPKRRDQLYALADGFDRLVSRIEGREPATVNDN